MKSLHSISSLWSSHIHTIKYNEDATDNKKLAEIAEDYCSKTFNFETDFKHSKPLNILLLYKDKSLVWLLNEIKSNLFFYINKHYGINENDIDATYYMWGNVEKFAEWSLPHAHQGNQIVITYYPYVNVDRTTHKYAGSFSWHPPTTFMSDYMIRKEPTFLPNVLETGSMVIFNGHTLHSTFPSFNKEDKKIALVTNIKFRAKNSKDPYSSIDEMINFQNS
jgi:hypothetical protein